MFKHVYRESRPNGLPPLKRTYRGFHAVWNINCIVEGGEIVLVFVEGDVEVWAIDGEKGLQALKSYYKDTCDFDNVQFHIYKEVK